MQQVERRQPVWDRAAERVRVERPARQKHCRVGYSHSASRRGYCPIPDGTGPLQRNNGACAVLAGVRADTNRTAQQRRVARTKTHGPACARRPARHPRGRADAQSSQQLERRQRGGDRAVERVRAEIPARPPVRHGYSRSTCRQGYCRGYSPVPPGTGHMPTGTGGVPTATGCEDTRTAVQGYVRGSSQG